MHNWNTTHPLALALHIDGYWLIVRKVGTKKQKMAMVLEYMDHDHQKNNKKLNVNLTPKNNKTQKHKKIKKHSILNISSILIMLQWQTELTIHAFISNYIIEFKIVEVFKSVRKV